MNKVYSLLLGGGIGIALVVSVILVYKNISVITSKENLLAVSVVAGLTTLYKIVKYAGMRHFRNQEMIIELLYVIKEALKCKES